EPAPSEGIVGAMSELGIVGAAKRFFGYFQARPRLTKAVQITLIVATVGLCVAALVDQWHKAEPHLANARPGYVLLAFVTLASYSLVFILGWIRMLEEWAIRVPYRVALQAEMVSMLAKYLPGGVWTPAARTVALRRSADVTETGTVLGTILVE